ncbi:ribosome maturation factor RimP [Orrella sp. 11846]|uniref:ribosome maturation factor RimP n=1 Tax=Orrella sp. 11846 TaxID=3409913 RepID=UPI003B5B2BC4
MIDLIQLTREALASMDLEVVSVERAPMGLLRVTIDRPDGVRIEHCELASRQLSRVYEVEDIDYRRLEVGSPGVDRPLRTVEDFERFAGERVEIRLFEAVDGQKTFVGQLLKNDAEGKQETQTDENPSYAVVLETKKGVGRRVEFTFDEVERAKLNPLLNFKGKKR